jgi:hypothetical protein
VRAVVPAKFLDFTTKHEGDAEDAGGFYFYLDVDGWVTIGLGNKVDPLRDAMGLDYVWPDGTGVHWSDVARAWGAVKMRQDLRKKGGGPTGPFPALTKIRATRESIAKRVHATLLDFDRKLIGYFPEWETWPADAQLGCLSMAWAMGPHFPRTWPKFSAACRARNWADYETIETPNGLEVVLTKTCAAGNASASKEELERQNPSFRDRNARNVAFFESAAFAEAAGNFEDVLSAA